MRDIDAIAKVDWACLVLDEAQAIKNHTNETAQQLRRIGARTRVALTGTPIENGLGDLWAILDFTNPGLVGPRPQFIASLSGDENGGGVAGGAAGRAAAEDALRALNGILVFRRTKPEPEIQAELPDKIDQLDHCAMTTEQIGLYQAVLDKLVLANDLPEGEEPRKGQILAAITALKQICNHPAAYQDDDRPLDGRSGKLARLEEIVESVFAAGERVLVFTHFAEWGLKLADHLTKKFDQTDRVLPRRPVARRARRDGRSASRTPTAPPRWCCRSRPAAPGSTSPPPTTSCCTTAGGTPRSKTRRATARGASARPRPSSATGWCAPAPSTSGSKRWWRASDASPTSCCRSRARSPTSTPASSAPRSASAPTPCSPRRTRE